MPYFNQKGVLNDLWEVKSKDGVLLLSSKAPNASLTLTLADNVRVAGIILHDNDPKLDEAGWSLNGTLLPYTGNGGWVFTELPQSNIFAINSGGDSIHFNICIYLVQ